MDSTSRDVEVHDGQAVEHQSSQARPLLDLLRLAPVQDDAEDSGIEHPPLPSEDPPRRWLRQATSALLLSFAVVMVIGFGVAGFRRQTAIRDSSGEALRKGEELFFLARPQFRRIKSGVCPDIGMVPIDTKAQCEAAARALRLPDTTALPVALPDVPEGCYYLSDQRDGNTGLWLGTNKLNKGLGAETTDKDQGKTREPVCRLPANHDELRAARASAEAAGETVDTTTAATRTSTQRPHRSRSTEPPPMETTPEPRVHVALQGPPVQEKHVLKGISYSPLPHRGHENADFSSDGAAGMWGRHGRGDLGIIKALGANAVRLHGTDPALGHGQFLDEASEMGLEVIASMGNHPYMLMPRSCNSTDFNCYKQVKEHYAESLKKGFMRGDKSYHPALRTLILMNEPDRELHPASSPGVFCRALVSAFDAVLDAEAEAGVTGDRPNVTATFSFGACPRCTRYGYRPAVGQMLELRHAMQHPEAVGYTARNDLWAAYKRRFINSFNTANAARTIRTQFLDAYHVAFQSTPVFIGEYQSPHEEDLEQDLKTILDLAVDNTTLLTGLSFFEFQVRHDDKDSAKFGIFDLGDKGVGSVRIGDWELQARCLTPRVVAGRPETHSSPARRLQQRRCGWLEQDVEYEVEAWWTVSVNHVKTAEDCCQACGGESKCNSWTWLSTRDQCWLRDGQPTSKNRRQIKGFVSGLPPPRPPVPHHHHRPRAQSSSSSSDEHHEEATAEEDDDRGSSALVVASITKAFGGRGIRASQLCPPTRGGF